MELPTLQEMEKITNLGHAVIEHVDNPLDDILIKNLIKGCHTLLDVKVPDNIQKMLEKGKNDDMYQPFCLFPVLNKDIVYQWTVINKNGEVLNPDREFCKTEKFRLKEKVELDIKQWKMCNCCLRHSTNPIVESEMLQFLQILDLTIANRDCSFEDDRCGTPSECECTCRHNLRFALRWIMTNEPENTWVNIKECM